MPKRRVTKGLRDVESAWEQITKTIKVQLSTPGLSLSQLHRYEKVVTEWPNGTLPHTSLKYYRFLLEVKEVDSDYFVLCIIAFTQAELDHTQQHVKDALLKRIKKNRGGANNARNKIIATITTKTALQPGQKSSQKLLSTTSKCVSFTHAEREGTQEIFGEDMANKIKRPQMDRDWRAVTMRFPKKPVSIHDSCSLDLEIREEHVKELAKSLLGREIDWEPNSFPPHFSFRIRGASEESLSAVFRPVVHEAINERRMKELAEGEEAECISMTFRRGGATISLPMDLYKGIQIQRKLWIKQQHDAILL
ncbi:hypothetical protein ST47_g995 [Ascochyta rabiei]|uniref:Uncharacterized protein n=1 Tax=Didymella rabiei TaxID=5454 RepID=A0A163LJZ7_DIDRA|nr:hypothetical protein ST47_g995 [Ascochyta rabiei]